MESLTEEELRESSKLYQTGEYTLEDLADKYSTSVGKIRYGWRKYNLPSKLRPEAKHILMVNSATKRDYVELNKKRQATNVKRYGVPNVSSLQNIKQKREQVMLERYGVKNSNQLSLQNFDIIRDKTSLAKWASNFLKENNRQPTRSDLREAVGWKIDDSASKIIHKYKLEDMFSWKQSRLELAFEDMLLENGIEYEHNNRLIIAPLEIDYWLPKLNLGIEINDVATHNADVTNYANAKVKPSNYHREKSLKAIDMGINLIHLYEWGLKDEKYMKKLMKILTQETKEISVGSCELKEITKQEANVFFGENYLQGKCRNSSVNYGLYYKDKLCSVMAFGRSKEYDWELLAYCSTRKIMGGPGKLFETFLEKIGKDKQIVAYQDLDKILMGTLYKDLGFTYEETLGPEYQWVSLKTSKPIKGEPKSGNVRVYNSGKQKFLFTT